MDNFMEYIHQYNSSAEIVSFENQQISRQITMPDYWKKLFTIPEKDDRINSILNFWDRIMGKELRRTIYYLRKNLCDVKIISSKNSYSLIYCIKDLEGGIGYYEGGNPCEIRRDNSIPHWNKMPREIRRFYKYLHNGFYYFASVSMGLLPFNSIMYLGEYEWGILEEIPGKLEINLQSSYGLFGNGMGAYVAVDLQNCKNFRATLWSAKEPPKYDLNFWDVVDDWIRIGFEK
jgi:hypothetical protein